LSTFTYRSIRLYPGFLETIRSVNPPDKWKVLVVDEHSQAMLGAVLKTYDVLEENVTRACLIVPIESWHPMMGYIVTNGAYWLPPVIESVSSRRSPQPTTEAIYLLMPTSANVERIINDFAANERQYAAAHVFFLDGAFKIILRYE
jgi:syntaxin-binding protein 1